MVHRSFVACLTALLAALPLAAQAPIRVDTAVAVPMRDGVVLRADVYRPAADGPVPGPGPPHALQPDRIAHRPAGRSPPCAADTRSCSRTSAAATAPAGVFEPYRQEGTRRLRHDRVGRAPAVVQRRGRAPSGSRYPGAVQWLAAVESPPSLKAMVPAMTFSTPENFWYSGGVWDGSWLDWTWLNIAPDLRRRLGVTGPTDRRGGRRGPGTRTEPPLGGTGPCSSCRDFKGVAPWYFEWMRHPPGDRLVELRPAPGTLRPGARGGAQPLRLVRRDVRAERRGGELSGRGRRARARTLDSRRRSGAAHARPASGTSALPRRWTTTGRCWAGWIATEGEWSSKATGRSGAGVRDGLEPVAHGRPVALARDSARHAVSGGPRPHGRTAGGW